MDYINLYLNFNEVLHIWNKSRLYNLFMHCLKWFAYDLLRIFCWTSNWMPYFLFFDNIFKWNSNTLLRFVIPCMVWFLCISSISLCSLFSLSYFTAGTISTLGCLEFPNPFWCWILQHGIRKSNIVSPSKSEKPKTK